VVRRGRTLVQGIEWGRLGKGGDHVKLCDERWFFAFLALLGCASAPAAKAPDESRRVPVNKVVPKEVSGLGSPRAEVRASDGSQLEWR
jgi:hypothetical protein